jgi:hypothetical protein
MSKKLVAAKTIRFTAVSTYNDHAHLVGPPHTAANPAT